MALIVGHSQAKYLHHYIEDYNITTLSYPGSRIDQLWPRIEELVPYFKVIAIFIGANDIRDGNSVKVLKKLQSLCEKIHEENPGAQVLVSHILPRVQSRFVNQHHEPTFLNHFNYTAYDVNRVLCKVASLQPWVQCVKFPMFVQDGVIQKHLLSRDGLHLSFQGTSYVASVIRESVLKFLCADVSSTAETELRHEKNS